MGSFPFSPWTHVDGLGMFCVMSNQLLSDRSWYKVRVCLVESAHVDASIPTPTGIANAANVSHQQHGSERICHIALRTVSTFIQISNFFWNMSKRFGTYIIYLYNILWYSICWCHIHIFPQWTSHFLRWLVGLRCLKICGEALKGKKPKDSVGLGQ